MHYYGKNYSLVKREKLGEKFVLTFDVKPDFLDRIFEWTKNHQRQYVGRGDQWYTYPDCEPCSFEFSELLCEVWIKTKILDSDKEIVNE